jgi:hypothetical protein
LLVCARPATLTIIGLEIGTAGLGTAGAAAALVVFVLVAASSVGARRRGCGTGH